MHAASLTNSTPSIYQLKHELSRPWALTVLFTNLYSIGSGYDKNSIFQTREDNTQGHMKLVIEF